MKNSIEAPASRTSFAAILVAAISAANMASALRAAPPLISDPRLAPNAVPKGVRAPSVDWSVHSLQIQQGNFIVAKIRNSTPTASPAPTVRLSATKTFPSTQSPPNSKGDSTGAGGSMSAIIADVQTPGTSSGQALDIQPYAIPKDYLECSEIVAEVDFRRQFSDPNWANNKVTIKTKCGATQATSFAGVARP